MAGRFKWKKFSECNINDPFFDSLKEDYIEFPVWFAKKSLAEGERALVCQDEKDQIKTICDHGCDHAGMLSSSMYLISISGTGICEAESAVDCDSCLWFYARAENRNVDRIFFGTSDRYSVWNGAGAVCTDLSDDRLCEWPVQ